MIDGIPNRPLYFYQMDIIVSRRIDAESDALPGMWLPASLNSHGLDHVVLSPNVGMISNDWL